MRCVRIAHPQWREGPRSGLPRPQDALASLGFDRILIEGWQQKINAHALAELAGLAELYSRSAWHAPSTASLPKALESLQEQSAEDLVLVAILQNLAKELAFAERFRAGELAKPAAGSLVSPH